MRKAIYNNYKDKHGRIRHLPTKSIDKEMLLLKIGKLKTDSSYMSLNICNKGYKLHDITLDMRKGEDKDLFYSEMMKWSLSHTIAKIKDDYFLEWYLIPSKNGQTNITLDVLDSAYNKMVELEEQRNYMKLAQWEARGIGLSA